MNLTTSLALQNLVTAINQDTSIKPEDRKMCISEVLDLLQRRYMSR